MCQKGISFSLTLCLVLIVVFLGSILWYKVAAGLGHKNLVGKEMQELVSISAMVLFNQSFIIPGKEMGQGFEQPIER